MSKAYHAAYRKKHAKRIQKQVADWNRKINKDGVSNWWAWRIKKSYGISVKEYKALLSKPCKICGSKATELDHDHLSGKIRAALCLSCNTGLGQFKDSPKLLNRAAAYIKRYA